MGLGRLFGAFLLAAGVTACTTPATTTVQHASNTQDPGGSGAVPAEVVPSSPPSGVPLRDKQTGYEVTLRIGESRVCMMIPEGAESSPACAGLNLVKFRDSFANKRVLRGGQRVIGLAFVKFKGWSAIVSSLYQPGEVDFDNITMRNGFVTGMREGALKKTPGARMHGDSDMEAYTTTTIGGRTGIKVIIERDEEEGTVAAQLLARWLMYSVSARGGVITTSFVSGSAHFADLSHFAKASMSTVRFPDGEGAKNYASLPVDLMYPAEQLALWAGE